MGKAKRKPAVNKPPKGATRTWWTDEQRHLIMATLSANGGDIPQTARETKCHPETIRCWKNGTRHPEATQLHDEKKGDLALASEELAWKFAALIPSKIDQANMGQMITGFGVLVDKMRLLRGEPTSYNQNDNRNTNINLVKLLEMLNDDQLAKLGELIDAGREDGHGLDTRRLPETSAVPPLERELSPILESGVQDQRPVNDVPG